MSRPTAIERAILSLEAERAVIDHAIAKLKQQVQKPPKRPATAKTVTP